MTISQTIRVVAALSLAFAVMASLSMGAGAFVLCFVWPKVASSFGGVWEGVVAMGVLSGVTGLMVGCISGVALRLAAKLPPTVPGNASLRRIVRLTASVTIAIPIITWDAMSSKHQSTIWMVLFMLAVVWGSYQTARFVPGWAGRILRKMRDPELVEIGDRLLPLPPGRPQPAAADG